MPVEGNTPATPVPITRSGIFADATKKMETLDTAMKAKVDAVAQDAGEITQGEMLALQYELQGYTLFVQTVSTIQKELADMVKGITSKI